MRPSLSCIQIWSLSSAPKSPASKKSKPMPKGADTGQMKCEMVLCLDTGPAYELKWCPLPSHDAVSPPQFDEGSSLTLILRRSIKRDPGSWAFLAEHLRMAHLLSSQSRNHQTWCQKAMTCRHQSVVRLATLHYLRLCSKIFLQLNYLSQFCVSS